MKNYTLVELLITVTIIFMGMAFLVSAMETARKDLNTDICRNNLKQLAQSCIAYAADNGDYLPAGTTHYRDRYLRWNNALISYQANNPKSLPACPSAAKPETSYGVNYSYNPKRNARIPFHYFDSQNTELSKLSKYSKQIPKIILIVDADNFTAISPRQLGCAPARDVSGNGINDSSRGADFNYYAPKRHENAMNYAACDGSVSLISFEVWEENFNHSGIIYDEQFDY